MRLLAIAALGLLAAPAYAQTTAPAVSTPASVPCTCTTTPAPAPAPVARTPVRRRTYARAPQTRSYPPFAFGSSISAYAPGIGPAPILTNTPLPQGILGQIPENTESIAFLGLGYTDGFIGAEAGAGGSGPLHAGY